MSVNDNLVRLNHMLEACQMARNFSLGQTRASLDDDPMLKYALVKVVEIVGEAANGISKPFQDSHPEIPWPAIIGMRNRLVHAYFDINLDRLWDTVMAAIPTLIPQLETLIRAEEKKAEDKKSNE
jgi:uncharacterized protein with HEPN domain